MIFFLFACTCIFCFACMHAGMHIHIRYARVQTGDGIRTRRSHVRKNEEPMASAHYMSVYEHWYIYIYIFVHSLCVRALKYVITHVNMLVRVYSHAPGQVLALCTLCMRALSLTHNLSFHLSLSLSLPPSLCPSLPLSFYTQHYLVDTINRDPKVKNEKSRTVDDAKGKIFDTCQ